MEWTEHLAVMCISGVGTFLALFYVTQAQMPTQAQVPQQQMQVGTAQVPTSPPVAPAPSGWLADAKGSQVLLSESSNSYWGVIAADAAVHKLGGLKILGTEYQAQMVQAAYEEVAKNADFGRFVRHVKRVRVVTYTLTADSRPWGGFASSGSDLITLVLPEGELTQEQFVFLMIGLGHESWHTAGYTHAQMRESQHKFAAKYGIPPEMNPTGD